ncbi:M20 family metallopeptidase [soil metagenome]
MISDPAWPSLATTPPIDGPHTEVKRRLAEAIEQHRDEILALSHRIHEHPEPAFEERQAASWVAEAVARHGYRVEHPAGRLETAVRGRLAGGLGTDGPRIGILAEYDALPGLGHGCGHNTMAASGVGAAIALASVASQLRGEIVFLGTPAEERGSGKQFMIDDGLLDGLDAALLFHPSDRTQTACALLASEDVEVTFTGFQAHAAADPWKGRNALDALVMLFSSIGLWRQQLRPDARVHGIVIEGGTAANIIPDRTVGRFMIRSTDELEFGRMRERFRQLVHAAALAADCEGEATFSGGSSTMKDNATLRQRFLANMSAYSITDNPVLPDQLGSSDMGNVSQVLPAIHPSIAICEEGVPGHSIEFRDAAASPRADEVTLIAAALVAHTAWDLFADPALVAAAWREFRGA